jgi:uncharacterized protein (DUF488 family)
MQVYTIGYGGRHPKDLLEILQHRGIERIIDVRLRPDRASMGVYAKARSADKGIQRLLAERGMAYTSMTELGNIFFGCDDWCERYQRLLESAADILFERLYAMPTPFCLLCAEREVTCCHRQLIADQLVQRGYDIEHLL